MAKLPHRSPKRPADGAKGAIRADYAALARRMVLHGVVTRQQLVDETGLSPGSATKHIQRLADCGFVETRRRPVPHAKRPIDELWLNPQAATFLAVTLLRNCLFAELVGLDLKPLYRYEIKLREITQGAILAAMGEAVQNAQQTAREFGREIDLMGLCVSGLVDTDHGLIYSLRAVPDWDACLPWEIIPAIRTLPQVNIWTQVACKVAGLCDELKRDHRVAYLECLDDNVSLAAMHDGAISHGRHGTSGGLLHVSIAKTGPACYCGRVGCFHRFLRSPNLDSKIMLQGLRTIFSRFHEEDFALEWSHALPAPEKALRDSGIKNFRLIENGDRYALRGLRAFTAQATLDKKVHALLSAGSH